MVPDDLRYTKEHEWVRVEGDEADRRASPQYAADQLGDIVFVELPAVGKALEQFATFGVVESVKAVSDLFAPGRGRGRRRSTTRWPTSPSSSTASRSARAGWSGCGSPIAAQVDGLLDAAGYERLVAEG